MENQDIEPSAWCYLLTVVGGNGTYVGATVDPDRRLRQHNKEIKGGAHATGIRVNQGLQWRRVCKVPMPDWKTALQFEWRWKQLGRTVCKGVKDPLQRRIASLNHLLSMEKATEAAIPFEMWPGGRPYVEWEEDSRPLPA